MGKKESILKNQMNLYKTKGPDVLLSLHLRARWRNIIPYMTVVISQLLLRVIYLGDQKQDKNGGKKS